MGKQRVKVKALDGQEIKTIRGSMTVREFSILLGVTPAAVFLWESGDRTPEGCARTLLRLLSKRPEVRVELKEIAISRVAEQLEGK